jgi:hypothetical protein
MSSDFHRMIAEFMREDGFDATFHKQLPAVSNDDDGTVFSDTTQYPIRAVKMDVFGNMAGNRTKLGTLIQEADQVLYVQPRQESDGFSLMDADTAADRVEIKGKLWKILALKEYDPSASDCVLYEMYIKR